jgi:hypothetical protein
MLQGSPMSIERPHQFKIMLSTDEKTWLEEVARRRGTTASDVLRHYIRETCEAELVQIGPLAQGILAVLSSRSPGPTTAAKLAELLRALKYSDIPALPVVLQRLVERGYVEGRGDKFTITTMGRMVPSLRNR